MNKKTPPAKLSGSIFAALAAYSLFNCVRYLSFPSFFTLLYIGGCAVLAFSCLTARRDIVPTIGFGLLFVSMLRDLSGSYWYWNPFNIFSDLFSYLLAMLICASFSVKKLSGTKNHFRKMWFLPALFSLVTPLSNLNYYIDNTDILSLFIYVMKAIALFGSVKFIVKSAQDDEQETAAAERKIAVNAAQRQLLQADAELVGRTAVLHEADEQLANGGISQEEYNRRTEEIREVAKKMREYMEMRDRREITQEEFELLTSDF